MTRLIEGLGALFDTLTEPTPLWFPFENDLGNRLLFAGAIVLVGVGLWFLG